MTQDNIEPIERPEENTSHPADQTLDAVHSQSTLRKKELASDRQELTKLLDELSQVDQEQSEEKRLQVEKLKEKISQAHSELMDILKTEENIHKNLKKDKN